LDASLIFSGVQSRGSSWPGPLGFILPQLTHLFRLDEPKNRKKPYLRVKKGW